MFQLPVYFFSAHIHPLLPSFVMLELDPVNISPLQLAWCLVSKEHGRATAGGKYFFVLMWFSFSCSAWQPVGTRIPTTLNHPARLTGTPWGDFFPILTCSNSVNFSTTQWMTATPSSVRSESQPWGEKGLFQICPFLGCLALVLGQVFSVGVKTGSWVGEVWNNLKYYNGLWPWKRPQHINRYTVYLQC